MIEVQGLCAGYSGHDVLKDVTISFAPGQILALLGPNGCGKSTLLRTVLGLQPKRSGQITIDGTPITDMTPRQVAQCVSYLAQSRNVPNITAERMVLHGRFPHLSYPRRYRQTDYMAVQSAMEWTRTAELAHRNMTELSGGQRQKVYLAMALAQDAKTILMDEPTTYLDVRHQLEVMQMARQLAVQGRAVVLVLHDICMAMRMSDTVAVMADGRIVQTGAPEEIYAAGIVDQVFQIALHRFQTADGWQYYYG